MNQWLTMSEAARACGRKPGGNIGKLMNKWGVGWTIYKGNKGYLKDDVSRIPHLHRTATAQAANDYIDKQTKGQAELPLTVKPTVKPVEKAVKQESKPPETMEEAYIMFARKVVTQADGCDYKQKYQDLVKRLNELKG